MGQQPSRRADRVRGLSTLQKFVRANAVAMMTSIDADGRLTSRPMLALLIQRDPHLYFLTRFGSHKASTLSDDGRVNVAFISPKGRYLSVTGTARFSRDARLLQRLWNPTYRAWFPKGQTDPEVLILAVSVETADYWQSPRSKVVRLVEMVKAALTGRPSEIERQVLYRSNSR